MNRDEWKIRDRKMRAWDVSERRRAMAYRGRAYYRDLPSRRPARAVLGTRPDGSAPDQLLYAREMRVLHIEDCRRCDFLPTLTAELYLAPLRAASAPVGRIP